MISVCGVICEKECHAFGTECEGCNQLKGKVSWTKFIGKETCPIYTCVKQKNYANCGACPDLPCKIMLIDTKHPDKTNEEYEKDINSRMMNLKYVNSKNEDA